MSAAPLRSWVKALGFLSYIISRFLHPVHEQHRPPKQQNHQPIDGGCLTEEEEELQEEVEHLSFFAQHVSTDDESSHYLCVSLLH